MTYNIFLPIARTSFQNGVSFRAFVEMAQKSYLEHVLRMVHYNQSVAARSIGIHRNVLNRYIAKLGIELPPNKTGVPRKR
jgi:DNA-binding NtrC family response regulator